MKTTFPAYDRLGWEQGDLSTAASGIHLGKLVSYDLNDLAPEIVRFLDNIVFSMPLVMHLIEQKTSGSSTGNKCGLKV